VDGGVGMPVKINGATSGSVTLAAPATGTDVTLTLPGSTGTLPVSSDIGLVKITDQTFSAASSVNINNCFSSTYDNYRIIFDPSAASTTLTMSIRLRASGADNSTANYIRQNLNAQQATVGAVQFTGATSWGFGGVDGTYVSYNRFAFDICAPQLTRYTVAVVPSLFVSTSAQYYANLDAYLFNATTSFDGFSILTSTGTITGTVRVYGYRN
jgi:hypothetical protein